MWMGDKVWSGGGRWYEPRGEILKEGKSIRSFIGRSDDDLNTIGEKYDWKLVKGQRIKVKEIIDFETSQVQKSPTPSFVLLKSLETSEKKLSQWWGVKWNKEGLNKR